MRCVALRWVERWYVCVYVLCWRMFYVISILMVFMSSAIGNNPNFDTRRIFEGKRAYLGLSDFKSVGGIQEGMKSSSHV